MNEMDLLLKTFSGGLKTISKGIYSFAEMLEKMNVMPDEGRGKEEEKETPAEIWPVPHEVSELSDDYASEMEAAQKEKRPVGRPRKKPGQKKKKKSGIDRVYGVIKRAKSDGISLDEISSKTGFDKAKINNIIFRLKEQKKIVAVRRGTYRKTTKKEVKRMEAEEALSANAPVSDETAASESVEIPSDEVVQEADTAESFSPEEPVSETETVAASEGKESEEAEIEPPAGDPEIEPEEAKEE